MRRRWHDLENGATGLTLAFAGANGAAGYGLEPTAERHRQGYSTAFSSTPVSPSNSSSARNRRMAAVHLADHVKRKGIVPAACDIRFGLDPIGACAVRGSSPMRGPTRARSVQVRSSGLPRVGSSGPFAVADGRVVHDAGGSEAQELAFVLAIGVAYLRALESAGIALDDARKHGLCTPERRRRSVPDHGEIPRAALVVGADRAGCGLAPKPAFIAAETAWRMLTQRDPYVNMLRATIATFSAGLGGANAITVLPHTLALGLPDPFARRVARNTQLVLLEESNLAKVSDPAAGSGGSKP